MTRAVDQYLDAARAVAALKTAARDEGETPARRAALLVAQAEARTRYGALNGGQIGSIRRLAVTGEETR